MAQHCGDAQDPTHSDDVHTRHTTVQTMHQSNGRTLVFMQKATNEEVVVVFTQPLRSIAVQLEEQETLSLAETLCVLVETRSKDDQRNVAMLMVCVSIGGIEAATRFCALSLALFYVIFESFLPIFFCLFVCLVCKMHGMGYG